MFGFQRVNEVEGFVTKTTPIAELVAPIKRENL